MFFGNSDGGCTSASCTNVSPDDPDTVRVMLFAQRSMDAVNQPNCAADGGTISSVSSVLKCVTNLAISVLTDYALTDIQLFNQKALPVDARVTWKTGYSPAIAPASTYPNVLYAFPTIAGVVNCSQSYSSTFRLGWKVGATNSGPCLNDALFGGFRCVALGTAVGTSYADESGANMASGTRWKAMLCPDPPERR